MWRSTTQFWQVGSLQIIVALLHQRKTASCLVPVLFPSWNRVSMCHASHYMGKETNSYLLFLQNGNPFSVYGRNVIKGMAKSGESFSFDCFYKFYPCQRSDIALLKSTAPPDHFLPTELPNPPQKQVGCYNNYRHFRLRGSSSQSHSQKRLHVFYQPCL